MKQSKTEIAFNMLRGKRRKENSRNNYVIYRYYGVNGKTLIMAFPSLQLPTFYNKY